jgi:hypothetical protein
MSYLLQAANAQGTGAAAVTDVADTVAAARTIQTVTPSTGDTVTVTSGRNVVLIVNPASSLLLLTINMAGSPQHGDIVALASTQAISTVTMGGGTFVGAVASLAIGGFSSLLFHSTIGKWLRIG